MQRIFIHLKVCGTFMEGMQPQKTAPEGAPPGVSRYGYEDIETPGFEYFEVFSNEVGTIPSKDLYKFFDREGNTLVLRPDFTPSVSRACATYFSPGKRTCKTLLYRKYIYQQFQLQRSDEGKYSDGC